MLRSKGGGWSGGQNSVLLDIPSPPTAPEPPGVCAAQMTSLALAVLNHGFTTLSVSIMRCTANNLAMTEVPKFVISLV